MRPGTGCQPCRSRHLKCVVPSGQSTCTRCAEAGRKCMFLSRYRFRQVSHVDTASQGLRSRTELQYESDQPWVQTAGPVNFVFEDGLGVEYGAAETEGMEVDGEGLMARNARSPARADDEATLNGIENGPDQAKVNDSMPGDLGRAGVLDPDDFSHFWDTGTRCSSAKSRHLVPASIPELTRRYVFGVTTGSITTPHSSLEPGIAGDWPSPATSLPTPGSMPNRLSLSRREAFLMHHYINKIAPWIDCCDFLNHFGLDVPRRAAYKPMLLFSVLALSSMHQAVSNSQSPHEASFYHGECLRLLINALSDDETTCDDNLLASVVLMRVYEEIDRSTDDFHHLRGLGRLLDAIPTFAHSGGLAEAACWQSLRQDIFVSLLKAQPPTFDLANYDRSSAFKFRDESGCANVIVLMFAKVLRLTYSSAEASLPETWATLETDIERWNDRRCRLFQPIFEDDIDPDGNQPFPTCCLVNPPQVVAVQYYYSCMAFLLLHRPTPRSLSGFHKAKHRRSAEKLVASYIATIVGLAISNEAVENANFTAEHLLRTCGYCINHPIQRRAALDFLASMQRRMGWSTAETSELLRSQWLDLDSPGG